MTIKEAIKIFDSVCGMCPQKKAALFCFALTHFPLQVVRISTFQNEAVIDGFLCLALALSLLSFFFLFLALNVWVAISAGAWMPNFTPAYM